MILQDQQITGIKIDDIGHNFCLYTDDMVLHVVNPIFFLSRIKLSHTILFRQQHYLIKFIWSFKYSRLTFDILHRSANTSNLGVPDLLLCYEAAQLTNLTRFFPGTPQLNWVHITVKPDGSLHECFCSEQEGVLV